MRMLIQTFSLRHSVASVDGFPSTQSSKRSSEIGYLKARVQMCSTCVLLFPFARGPIQGGYKGNISVNSHLFPPFPIYSRLFLRSKQVNPFSHNYLSSSVSFSGNFSKNTGEAPASLSKNLRPFGPFLVIFAWTAGPLEIWSFPPWRAVLPRKYFLLNPKSTTPYTNQNL